ncbi:hypothetical protein CXG81DRAFT_9293 [Caulochytrium protostelioides]|uniref:Malate dehydrogenase n=1 Tax=Caulochytrium protostelioides TaxID=1555241 RepID=A0A4V1IVC8_9FUNG|nr:hypothetical protein CXG81DRAFT_9293 [Caulochytrium protostelioides]|eukprot:RKP03609.1 hypothetical protein CXG81DRAFT_9293 [Caulochytrium protostelioides]
MPRWLGPAPQPKVAILGAAGGIGQPLSLLVKINPLVSQLSLYDLVNTPGVAADLSHIMTDSEVKGFKGDAELKPALEGAQIVVIPAGVPRKPGMTRDDLFNINAGIVKTLATAIATTCPKALIAVISNPVNSTVPIVAEVLKAHGVYDPRRLFGVTTLDLVRAAKFISPHTGAITAVPVIGGHSGATIVPVVSAVSSAKGISAADRAALIQRIQFGGDEVVKAKDGAGSATLSMAYAGSLFVDSLLKGLTGKATPKEYTFVNSEVAKEFGLEYFASEVTLGPNGVETYHALPSLDADEKKLLEVCVNDLKANIAKGVDFVKNGSK